MDILWFNLVRLSLTCPVLFVPSELIDIGLLQKGARQVRGFGYISGDQGGLR